MHKPTKLDLLRKQLLQKTREQVQEHFESPEASIIQAVNTLQDLDSVFNLLLEHTRTWYGLHFPELERSVKSNDTYLKHVLEQGFRENFASTEFSELAKKSMGSAMKKQDLEQIQNLAKIAQSMRTQREQLIAYLEQEMKTAFPNFSILCGAVLGAKILALIGSKKRLAEMPASTLQLVGAEKALFQHLKTGSKPPKHGLIFQHPLIQKCKRKMRGKLARTLAAKLSIALKEDYFGNQNIVADLQKKIDARVAQLNQ
ncbi:MAG: hypothetical protein Q7S92_03415 [Candidatus Diapherotrites archaeon]|nr:hypothetical protein [Candidatus Diapherotrites archaeon]